MFHEKLQEFIVIPILTAILALLIRWLIKSIKNGDVLSVTCISILFSILLVWSIFYGIGLYYNDLKYVG